MKTPAEAPSTEDLKTTLRVLQAIAGTKVTFPYLPGCAVAATGVMKEIQDVLLFRELQEAKEKLRQADVIVSFTRMDVEQINDLILAKNNALFNHER